MSRQRKLENSNQIRKINGYIKSSHQNEEKRNKAMREIDKNIEEFLSDRERVKRLADLLQLQHVSTSQT